jgi:hypothetical protein
MTLHRKWFDLIASRQKNKEFRSKTDYWRKRLFNKNYSEIIFRNGYSLNSPIMRLEYLGYEETDDFFVISLGNILELKNYEPK